jgi:hypothetical protein
MKLFTVLLMSSFICANIQPVKADLIDLVFNIGTGYAAREADKYIEKNGPNIELPAVISLILTLIGLTGFIFICIVDFPQACCICAGVALSDHVNPRNKKK